MKTEKVRCSGWKGCSLKDCAHRKEHRREKATSTCRREECEWSGLVVECVEVHSKKKTAKPKTIPFPSIWAVYVDGKWTAWCKSKTDADKYRKWSRRKSMGFPEVLIVRYDATVVLSGNPPESPHLAKGHCGVAVEMTLVERQPVRPTPDYKLAFGGDFANELLQAGHVRVGTCSMNNGKQGIVFRPGNTAKPTCSCNDTADRQHCEIHGPHERHNRTPQIPLGMRKTK